MPICEFYHFSMGTTSELSHTYMQSESERRRKDIWIDKGREAVALWKSYIFISIILSVCPSIPKTVVSRPIWLQFSHSGWIEMRFIDGKYHSIWFLATPPTLNICDTILTNIRKIESVSFVLLFCGKRNNIKNYKSINGFAFLKFNI